MPLFNLLHHCLAGRHMYVCMSYIIGTSLSSDSNGIVHLQGKKRDLSPGNHRQLFKLCHNYYYVIDRDAL